MQNELALRLHSGDGVENNFKNAALFPGRPAYGFQYKFKIFVRVPVQLDPFTDPLKNIRVNRLLSCHQMHKLQRFPQQFQASKSATAHGNLETQSIALGKKLLKKEKWSKHSAHNMRQDGLKKSSWEEALVRNICEMDQSKGSM